MALYVGILRFWSQEPKAKSRKDGLAGTRQSFVPRLDRPRERHARKLFPQNNIAGMRRVTTLIGTLVAHDVTRNRNPEPVSEALWHSMNLTRTFQSFHPSHTVSNGGHWRPSECQDINDPGPCRSWQDDAYGLSPGSEQHYFI